MDSEIYVGIKVEWSTDHNAHVIKADIPEELYGVLLAWSAQDEIEVGLWKLTLTPKALQFLSDNPSVEAEMVARGAVSTSAGKPANGSIRGCAKAAGNTLSRKLGGNPEPTSGLKNGVVK